MAPEEKLNRCQEALSYRFKDVGVLSRALTHSSSKTVALPSNERLEFLGDSVLGLIISEYLYGAHPELEEGEMTQIKSVVVSKPTLAAESDRIKLWSFLSVGKGLLRKVPARGGSSRRGGGSQRHGLPASLLANVFEAVIGAIYLDGGLEEARKFVLSNLARQIELVRKSQHKKNYKSILQELLQKNYGLTPVYSVIRERGPEHEKSFEVAALVGGTEYGRARGRTKREAEQNAARAALKRLKEEAPSPARKTRRTNPV
jgi:ribonuclease-3